MKEVIERLFQRMPSGSGNEIAQMKEELLRAAENGLEGVQSYFEKSGQALLEEADKMAEELNPKLGS
jgi:hypothetical protein